MKGLCLFAALGVGLFFSCGKESSSEGGARNLELPEIGSAQAPWLGSSDFNAEGVLSLPPDHLQYAVKTLDFRSFWSRFDAKLPQLTVGAVPSDCATYDQIESLAKVVAEKGSMTVTTEFPPTKCEVDDVTINVSYRRHIQIGCDEFDFTSLTMKDLATGLPEFQDCASLTLLSHEEVHSAQLWTFGNGYSYYNVKVAKRSVGGEQDGTACAFKITDHEIEQTERCFIHELEEDLENYSNLTGDLIPVGKFLKIIETKDLKGRTDSGRPYYDTGSALAKINDWTAQVLYDAAAESGPFTYVFSKEGADSISGDEECSKFPLCE